MKNKLRKIAVNNLEYLYYIAYQYHSATETTTLTVKVFLKDYKQTPLVIEFLAFDDYYMGHPLKFGMKLMNKIKGLQEEVNLNEPKYINQLIVLGRKNGWSGINTIEKQNGLSYLEELGFETDPLK
ncbi:hypothetical protein LF887_19340 [Chryseobacterium sp. MEBOG06]|uniref:hypothetical protein n=1 Tax=Chryseobacterium sp. MEBOG06 TaxID=2879938 RepID=UPI001F3D1379|nr:hypothetical protein [Chryseobacterium sp. MEBOG06]UKB83145.1 hypothetical protein LF887_19340 [Chryseobacterium sp. MEBOG06]